MLALAAILIIIPFIALAVVVVFGGLLAWGVAHAIADRQREAARERASRPTEPSPVPATPGVVEVTRLTA